MFNEWVIVALVVGAVLLLFFLINFLKAKKKDKASAYKDIYPMW